MRKIEPNTHRNFLWGSFIPANKHRYGPVMAHRPTNLKHHTVQTSDNDSLFILTRQVTHPDPATCHLQVLHIAVMAAPMSLAVILPEQLFLSVYIIEKHHIKNT